MAPPFRYETACHQWGHENTHHPGTHRDHLYRRSGLSLEILPTRMHCAESRLGWKPLLRYCVAALKIDTIQLRGTRSQHKAPSRRVAGAATSRRSF